MDTDSRRTSALELVRALLERPYPQTIGWGHHPDDPGEGGPVLVCLLCRRGDGLSDHRLDCLYLRAQALVTHIEQRAPATAAKRLRREHEMLRELLAQIAVIVPGSDGRTCCPYCDADWYEGMEPPHAADCLWIRIKTWVERESG